MSMTSPYLGGRQRGLAVASWCLLGKYRNNISFCQVIMETTDENIRRVLVFIVPRSSRYPEFKLLEVDSVDFLDDAVR